MDNSLTSIRDQMMFATRKHQSWRSEMLTDQLAAEMLREGIPFCWSCADWHHDYEVCSMTMGPEESARERSNALTAKLGLVSWLLVAASLGASAQALYDYYDGPHAVPTPICKSEDSPSCWWVDPDTGTVYWNDADTGKAETER